VNDQLDCTVLTGNTIISGTITGRLMSPELDAYRKLEQAVRAMGIRATGEQGMMVSGQKQYDALADALKAIEAARAG
jgi:hypothetical protein